MERFKMISGEEIVAKGATKIEVTLPEVGHKDVLPNGSWLEQKQIQSALAARKHLIEQSHIEKSGVLSHAQWIPELKLAEVTQQCGGHWQYLGHHSNKRLYLRPEEALYLMEVNCLVLRFNEVVVSLQQAYSLLLNDTISIMQYRVYGSLSRLGYKVFKYVAKPLKKKELNEDAQLSSKTQEHEEQNKEVVVDSMTVEISGNDKSSNVCNESMNVDHEAEGLTSNEILSLNKDEEMNLQDELNSDANNELDSDLETAQKEITPIVNSDTVNQEVSENTNISLEGNNESNIETRNNDDYSVSQDKKSIPDEDCEMMDMSRTEFNSIGDSLKQYCQWKLQKLKNRLLKSISPLSLHKSFEKCPDMSENQIVTVETPSEEFLPKNIFLNNLHYVINLENVRTKNAVRPSSEGTSYSITDEVNGAHIRRVTSSSVVPSQRHHSRAAPFNQPYRPNMPFRHNHWRPRTNTNYYQFNLFFQRPQMQNYNSRFQFYPRVHMPMFPIHCGNPNNSRVDNECRISVTNIRKRRKDTLQNIHLKSIKNLVHRLKQLNDRGPNVQAIQTLIQTYNARFRTKLRLSSDLEIVNDETIVATITLDDDDESEVKKRRLDTKSDIYHEYFNKIRQTAFKLKCLEADNKSSARHRRALSNVIKTFNKYFDADIYVTSNHDVLDKRHINLDSSSDSDCVVEDKPISKGGKKLRNPFNILKQLSEKHGKPVTSRTDTTAQFNASSLENYYEILERVFSKNWLPDITDFGRPEIALLHMMSARILETRKEQYLLDFYKTQSCNSESWADIKIAFLESIEQTNAFLETEAMMENTTGIKSLVQTEDCTDRQSVLNKLSIIKCNKNCMEKCSLTIDFDVYNKDVQNFRKNDRPKPHFRVVCMDETKPCPTGSEIATLHASIGDGVAILFAVVGISSISYMQLNPMDLPVYMPSN